MFRRIGAYSSDINCDISYELKRSELRDLVNQDTTTFCAQNDIDNLGRRKGFTERDIESRQECDRLKAKRSK